MDNNYKYTTIHVLDSAPGTGKTTSVIKMMNNNPNKKFIYISPNLTEAERIVNSCPKLNFKEPSDKNKTISKSENLLSLIGKYENISSTHSLFEKLTDETLDALSKRNYTFIMDETFSVLEKFKMFPSINAESGQYLTQLIKSNMDSLLEYSIVKVDKTFKVIWTTDKAFDGYRNVKDYCDRGLLYYMGRGALMWSYPARFFNKDIFEEIFILTYQFDMLVMKSYFSYHAIDYNKYFTRLQSSSSILKTGNDCFGVSSIYKTQDASHDLPFVSKLKKNIKIVEYPAMNAIGNEYYALSHSWYKYANQQQSRDISSKMTNFFTNYSDALKHERMWTVFKQFSYKIQGKYLRKNKDTLIELNVRATNNFRHKRALVYPVNRFYHPSTKTFFSARKVGLKDDDLALSEMLQWLMRSRLREGKSIDLFIPSRRQRNILKAYLNNEEYDKDKSYD